MTGLGGLSQDVATRERWLRLALFLAMGVAVGAAVIVAPLPVGIGAILALGAAWYFGRTGRPAHTRLALVVGLLIGYAFLGRGLAHVGAPPLYVGELVLALGVVALLVTMPHGRLGPIRLLILAFMAWGVLQTIPYIGRYGVDALRDAVTWGYALFALLISLLVTGRDVDRITGIYRKIVPLFLIWVPVTAALTSLPIPAGPGSDVPLISMKSGDIGVQLAGVAAFALLGLYAGFGRRPWVPEWLMWVLFFPAAVVVAIFNRGGLAAMTTAAAVVLFLRLPRRWIAPLLVIAALTLGVIVVNPEIRIGSGRVISIGQFVDNVTSVVTEGDDAALEGTKEFRLAWWGEIVDYTINGPFFWTGKGFGVNLADDDGFQVTADHSLRAPHNGHMEILARTGVPGLAIWLALNAVIAVSLLRAAGRARRAGQLWWVAIDGWLFVYWAAATVNASFDPYLQGPQGGIWFWVMVGLAIVAVEASTAAPVDDPEPDLEAGPGDGRVAVPGAA